MDILIKGLEMPSCCNSCPFLYAHYGEMGCRFVGRIKEIFSPNRPKNCPLIPVPEHGDLIDRDKEIDEWEQTRCIMSECGQKHTFEYRKACVVINALSQAEVVLERTT